MKIQHPKSAPLVTNYQPLATASRRSRKARRRTDTSNSPQHPLSHLVTTEPRSAKADSHSAFSCLMAVSLIFLTACSTTRPRVVGSYASTLREPQTESQSLIAMSDQEARQQRAGTTKTRQTASSQTIAKQGQIKKQTSTSEEVIQTETIRVIDSIAIPTSDQDAR